MRSVKLLLHNSLVGCLIPRGEEGGVPRFVRATGRRRVYYSRSPRRAPIVRRSGTRLFNSTLWRRHCTPPECRICLGFGRVDDGVDKRSAAPLFTLHVVRPADDGVEGAGPSFRMYSLLVSYCFRTMHVGIDGTPVVLRLRVGGNRR